MAVCQEGSLLLAQTQAVTPAFPAFSVGSTLVDFQFDSMIDHVPHLDH